MDNTQSGLRPAPAWSAKHYQPQAGGLQPWDLQRVMESSGSAFVDARRADVMRYAFRVKGDRSKQIEDLRKAADCANAAADELARIGNAQP